MLECCRFFSSLFYSIHVYTILQIVPSPYIYGSMIVINQSQCELNYYDDAHCWCLVDKQITSRLWKLCWCIKKNKEINGNWALPSI